MSEMPEVLRVVIIEYLVVYLLVVGGCSWTSEDEDGWSPDKPSYERWDLGCLTTTSFDEGPLPIATFVRPPTHCLPC